MGKHKSLIVLGVAVLVALLASVLIYRVLQKKTYERAQASIETQPVVVAVADLAWGTSLTKEMMNTVSIPKEYALPGSFSDPDSLVGRVVVYPVKTNEPILESRLAPKDAKSGGVAAVIAPKKRAVAVKVDKVIGVAGFIHPGNRVDVLVTLVTGRSGNPVTKVVLENILVLAAGPAVEKKGKEPTQVDVITLEVTPEEAEKLALAATEGKIQLALRNFSDTEDVLTRGMTVPALLASYSSGSVPSQSGKVGVAQRSGVTRKSAPGVRVAASKPDHQRVGQATESTVAVNPSVFVVELIKGSKVQEIKFERSE